MRNSAAQSSAAHASLWRDGASRTQVPQTSQRKGVAGVQRWCTRWYYGCSRGLQPAKEDIMRRNTIVAVLTGVLMLGGALWPAPAYAQGRRGHVIISGGF